MANVSKARANSIVNRVLPILRKAGSDVGKKVLLRVAKKGAGAKGLLKRFLPLVGVLLLAADVQAAADEVGLAEKLAEALADVLGTITVYEDLFEHSANLMEFMASELGKARCAGDKDRTKLLEESIEGLQEKIEEMEKNLDGLHESAENLANHLERYG